MKVYPSAKSLNTMVVFLQIIPVIGVALNGANVVGYVKCRSDERARLTQMAGQFIGKQILKQVSL